AAIIDAAHSFETEAYATSQDELNGTSPEVPCESRRLEEAAGILRYWEFPLLKSGAYYLEIGVETGAEVAGFVDASWSPTEPGHQWLSTPGGSGAGYIGLAVRFVGEGLAEVRFSWDGVWGGPQQLQFDEHLILVVFTTEATTWHIPLFSWRYLAPSIFYAPLTQRSFPEVCHFPLRFQMMATPPVCRDGLLSLDLPEDCQDAGFYLGVAIPQVLVVDFPGYPSNCFFCQECDEGDLYFNNASIEETATETIRIFGQQVRRGSLGSCYLLGWTPAQYDGGWRSLKIAHLKAAKSDDYAGFAALLGDGSVATWGKADLGGDSSAVQEQLRDVQQIQTSDSAFAAILINGSVVTWGDADSGGDSSGVQEQLRDVQQIQTSDSAFAAIRRDGSVVTWGDVACGGNSSAVQHQLRDVRQIQASDWAFAAILGDGSVVAWGYAAYGGDSSAVQDQLRDVQQIQACRQAFAAILHDGSVVTWGDARCGGDSSAVQDQLRDVQQIQASDWAFAAILGDGSVVAWGYAAYGGDSSAVQDQLRDVQQIQACTQAFAAILRDGSVVTWGDARFGGDSSAVQDQLRDVQQIQASRGAFAAILGDGSVATWGNARYGGHSSVVRDQLRDVQQIQASHAAFAAIRSDGSVVTWGSANCGGDSSAVQEQLRDVQQIQASNESFAAIMGDGSVVTWGNADFGGDSSAVQAAGNVSMFTEEFRLGRGRCRQGYNLISDAVLCERAAREMALVFDGTVAVVNWPAALGSVENYWPVGCFYCPLCDTAHVFLNRGLDAGNTTVDEPASTTGPAATQASAAVQLLCSAPADRLVTSTTSQEPWLRTLPITTTFAAALTQEPDIETTTIAETSSTLVAADAGIIYLGDVQCDAPYRIQRELEWWEEPALLAQ
ncbi:unnamed protein product, partial [Symbiodinium sp. KB8]